MKADAAELLKELASRADGPITERVVKAMAHGTMSVEFYAPVGRDEQQPHQQDELYIVHSGKGIFLVGEARYEFGPGSCFFVPAGALHKFEQFSSDFGTWVIFWGPLGGERSA